MSTRDRDASSPEHERAPIDWGEVARTALGSAFLAGLVGGALHVLGKVIEAEVSATADEIRGAAPDIDRDDGFDVDEDGEVPADDPAEEKAEFTDSPVDEAAALLGVAPDADPDEIRAALRARLASSKLHPDHGGDGEEAKRLIAAKNLLIERARAMSPAPL